jgi:acetyltransferase EpsM
MKKRLVIVGGKGSGQIAMSVFEAVNAVRPEWQIEGFLNDIVPVGEYFGRYKVVGTSDEIKDFVSKGYYVHYTLHLNAKNKHDRVNKYQSYTIPLEANATAIHPSAYINPDSDIGHGVLILPNVSTSFSPKIDNYVHIYTGAFIGHDSVVHDYVTIAAHAVVGARININEGAHIGLNSSIKEDITIGKYSIVGMGAVVIRDTEDFSVVAGNPAKKINQLNIS